MIRRLFAIALAALALAAGVRADAQEAVAFSAETQGGYGRMIFQFAKPAEVTAVVREGVLVITFDRPFSLDESAVAAAMRAYVSQASRDGRSLRFGLKRTDYRVKTSAAGPRVAVDIVPPSFAGLPPDIAPIVIAGPPEPEPVGDPEKLPVLPVRIGEHADYSRIVFDYEDIVDYSISSDEGEITLIFSKPMKPQMTRLQSDPPPWVKTASWKIEDNKLRIDLKVEPESGLHHFRDGPKIAIDIRRPRQDIADAEGKPEAKPETKPQPTPPPPPPAGSDGAAVTAGEGPRSIVPPAATPPTPSPETPAPVAETPKPEPPAAEAHEPDVATAEEPAPKTPSAPETAREEIPAGPARPVAVDHLASDGDAAGAEAARPEPGDTPLKAQAQSIPNGLRIVFPFEEAVAAAAYRRGPHLWLVFEERAPLDLAAIDQRFFATVSAAAQVGVQDAAVVKLTLADTVLASIEADGTRWTVTLADAIAAPPQPLVLERRPSTVKEASVAAQLPGAAKLHWIPDPDAGDRIAVVTSMGPPVGLIASRKFVEFTALATAHGLAILPLVDDLAIRIEKGEAIISTPRGLTLSAGSVAQASAPPATIGKVEYPAYIDFAAWRAPSDAEFLATRQKLLAAQAAPGADMTKTRFDLARFYLANGMAPEALGALKLLADEDASAAMDPAYHAARGLANLLMDRLDEARADLTINELANDPHAALWRAMLALRTKDWGAVRRNLAFGERVIERYPADWQARLRLAAGRAALGVNDIEGLDAALAQVPQEGVPRPVQLEAELLRGRMLELLGRNAEALALYKSVGDSGYRPLAVEAQFREIDLKSRTGGMDAKAAIDALDRLRFQWRGDDTELEILRRLAQLQIAEGDPRNGLSMMRAAVANFPNSAVAREMQDEMMRIFEQLFVGGEADKLAPVQALGLYYDFKDLTPLGRMGDDMIRRLADRLIAVDLLQQAAELLQYQVDNRLDGVARASVATRLAVVYLLDRKPGKALTVIRSTRQSLLPPDLTQERRLLEARALNELKQFDAALEMIDGVEDAQSTRLRADIYWAARNWSAAAGKLEALVGPVAAGDAPLTPAERSDVLRAAVAYSLADDPSGVARVRAAFAQKMSASEDAKAFEVVTAPIEAQGVDFREIARRVAASDTLEAFMGAFRERYGVPAPGVTN